MGKELFNPHLNKFSIRKLNVGVCSVLLSTVFLLGTAATVNADETASGTVDDNISLPEKPTDSAVSQPANENTATSAVSETANSEASADQNQLVSPAAAPEQATPEKAQEANQTAETSNEAGPAEASRTRSIQCNIRQNQVLQLCLGLNVMASRWREEHHSVLPVLLAKLVLLYKMQQLILQFLNQHWKNL